MKLTCTLTGAQVETQTDEAAMRLIASGCFAKVEEEPKPKRTSRKKAAEKEA